MWRRGNQPNLSPTDIASIGSNASNCDHPVAKALAELLSSFTRQGGPGAEQVEEQGGYSPELLSECLLGLGFLPRFGRERGDPESKALSIRLTY